MTLEEAKKEIAGRKAMYDSIVDRISDPYNTARDFYKGEASGLSEAVDILAKVYTEPVGNPDKLTLRELARELRKIFGFGYLVAYGSELYGYRVRAYLLKPKYIPIGGFWFNETRGNDALLDISFSDLMCDLDLSEYADENGNIDYSRCIVEVTDASE